MWFSFSLERQMKPNRMSKRDFITLFGWAAVRPLDVYAQTPNLPMIGFLSTFSSRAIGTYLEAFKYGMNELGYVEGRNIGITYRFANGKFDQLDMLANDLVQHQVKLIGEVLSRRRQP
jgi:putative tryptophan/tyrosine transport system substrate-binding protein